jgi:hypothetical protein
MHFPKITLTLMASCMAVSAWCQTPQGEIKPGALVHTPESSQQVISGAQVALPASLAQAGIYLGPLKDAPQVNKGQVPVVVFMHGSSGLGLKAIGEWQRWLAGMGVASIAPDSFGLKNRMTYNSPIDKVNYEKVHALRASEIALTVQALRNLAWADPAKWILAGTSEGAVPVARHTGQEFIGRILFAWGCEDNYFVESHRTAIPDGQPVLNIISSTDPYFSPSNSWVGNPSAVGHCGSALKTNKKASVVLIPGGPHTVLMFPQAKGPVEGFLKDLFKI